MTQMAIILAAPQQTPPESPPVNTSQNKFSRENEFTPHLENAVAEATEASSAIPTNLTIPVADQNNADMNLFANIPSQSLDLPETTFVETINDIKAVQTRTVPTLTEQIMAVPTLTEQTKAVPTLTEQAKAVPTLTEQEKAVPTLTEQTIAVPTVTELTGKIGITPAAVNMQNVISATFSSEKQPGATGQELGLYSEKNGEILNGELKTVPLQTQSPGITNNSPLKVEIGVNGTQFQPAPSSAPIGKNTVLEQLQLIINNSNETGTVSIEGTVNKYSFQYTGETEPKLTGFVFSQLHETEKITDKPNLKNSTLRQDINGQYLEAKLNSREQNNSGFNAENKSQQSNSNSEQLSSPPSQNQTLAQENSSNYQQISTVVQDVQNQQTQIMAKPVTLPSGTVVYEEDVIQQMIERFQVIRKPDDTRLTMKLHPAELGELKIDITVKEGSIKAHVVAQSQHVQEMVERNMLKLRNILEDQGFTIEELLVTSESDSVNDFNLFEQNLSHRDDFTPPINESNDKNGFNSILENAVEDASVITTGVNIKA